MADEKNEKRGFSTSQRRTAIPSSDSNVGQAPSSEPNRHLSTKLVNKLFEKLDAYILNKKSIQDKEQTQLGKDRVALVQKGDKRVWPLLIKRSERIKTLEESTQNRDKKIECAEEIRNIFSGDNLESEIINRLQSVRTDLKAITGNTKLSSLYFRAIEIPLPKNELMHRLNDYIDNKSMTQSIKKAKLPKTVGRETDPKTEKLVQDISNRGEKIKAAKKMFDILKDGTPQDQIQSAINELKGEIEGTKGERLNNLYNDVCKVLEVAPPSAPTPSM